MKEKAAARSGIWFSGISLAATMNFIAMLLSKPDRN
jgi:hypothetical protein